jgi:SAM-dependent methyltransferase
MGERDCPDRSYRNYVIKDGIFVARFDEMYQDVTDPWGCSEQADAFCNQILLALLGSEAPFDRVLDVGCGLGAFTELIRYASRAGSVEAFDISQTAIEKARRRIPEVGFFVHDMVGEPVLPREDRSFSLIVMAEVVWYILPVLAQVLAEFRRLLAPDGMLAIKQSFLRPGEQKYGNEVVASPDDLRMFVEGADLCVTRQVVVTESSREQSYLMSATPR